ncbi:MAG: V-type ATP synthase subunit E family protein [Fibrobacterota bacterium]
MEQKIQELTSKIYDEGVKKGEEEASRIVDEGKQKAEQIVKDAEKKAEEIVDRAKKEAAEVKKTNESEMKLAGQKAYKSIQQKITDMITASAVEKGLSGSMTPEILKEYIKTLLASWSPESGAEVVLPEKEKSELEKKFVSEISSELQGKVKVSFSDDIKGGFQIGPEGETYKITFAEEDFRELFTKYLRPKTRSFLFGE